MWQKLLQSIIIIVLYTLTFQIIEFGINSNSVNFMRIQTEVHTFLEVLT